MLNRTDVCALISSRNRASGQALGGTFFCSSFLKGSSILEPTRQIRNQSSIFLVPIVMMCRKGLRESELSQRLTVPDAGMKRQKSWGENERAEGESVDQKWFG